MRRALVLLAVTLAGCGETAGPPPAPTPEGTLFLAGRDPGTIIRVDTAAGTATTHRIRQLGPGDPPYMVHFAAGRLVVFRLNETSSLAPDLSDPRSLGEAWFFVPSATPGRVWNILRERDVFRFRGVREVTVTGQATFARHARVPGWPLAAVDGGLLIQRRTLRLWNPVTERVRNIPGAFPLATRGPLVASCAPRCRRVHLTDTTTGRHATVGGVRFTESYEGAFSPDGTQLAVLAAGGRIAVIDVRGRTAELIPGARTAPDYPLLAWASSGWLFYNAGGGRLGAWRPGAPARELGVSVGAFVDMTSD